MRALEDFFTSDDDTHIQALRYFNINGEFPEDFIPEDVDYTVDDIRELNTSLSERGFDLFPSLDDYDDDFE